MHIQIRIQTHTHIYLHICIGSSIVSLSLSLSLSVFLSDSVCWSLWAYVEAGLLLLQFSSTRDPVSFAYNVVSIQSLVTQSEASADWKVPPGPSSALDA